MKRKILLRIAYDGTNYAGWQIQKNGLAIQEVVDRALSDLFKEEIHCAGASRTDAGVHALDNVAVFETEARMPAEKVALALNTYLPEDIRVQFSQEVPEDFHPRFTQTIKTYEYRILNRPIPDPTRRLYTYFRYGELDVEAMSAAAGALVGPHDFASFRGSGGTEAGRRGTVRTIFAADVFRDGDEVVLRITGDGFLYHMVRIIAGTLIEIGSGDREAKEMETIINAKDRASAGATAPACGLTLLSIRYPEWEEDEDVE